MRNNKEIDQNAMAAWPEGGLEEVGQCPACGREESDVLYSELTDISFRCAPGTWSLRRCAACGSAFLAPRPMPQTLLLAYTSYYTHGSGRSVPQGWLRTLRTALANGYRNWRHGSRLRPAWAMGVVLAYAMPANREAMDFEGRQLPKVWPGARLLDVGCGSGAFLDHARSIGWQVMGVDFDPQAVSNARVRGLDVRAGGIEAVEDQVGSFDVVTISHVIEHVPDPAQLLKAAFRLLKKDGMLWLETPNIDAFGHARFGPYWRGLEVPRHLVVFSRTGLFDLMHKAGFCALKEVPRKWNYFALAAESRALATGQDLSGARAGLRDRLMGAFVRLRLFFAPEKTEFLTVTARKVGGR